MDKYFEALQKSKGSIALSIADQVGYDGTADVLEKGRAAAMGEIREWNGIRYQKTPKGWIPVKQQEGTLKTEPSSEFKGERAVSETSGIEDKLSDKAKSLLKDNGFELKEDKYVKDLGGGFSLEARELSSEEREKAIAKEGLKKMRTQLESKPLFIVEVRGPEGSSIYGFGDGEENIDQDYKIVSGDGNGPWKGTRSTTSWNGLFEERYSHLGDVKSYFDVLCTKAKKDQENRKEREKRFKEWEESWDNDPYHGEKNKKYSYNGGEKDTASGVFYNLWKSLQRKLYKANPGIVGSGQGANTYISRLKNEAEDWFKKHYQEKENWGLEDFDWLVEKVKS